MSNALLQTALGLASSVNTSAGYINSGADIGSPLRVMVEDKRIDVNKKIEENRISLELARLSEKTREYEKDFKRNEKRYWINFKQNQKILKQFEKLEQKHQNILNKDYSNNNKQQTNKEKKNNKISNKPNLKQMIDSLDTQKTIEIPNSYIKDNTSFEGSDIEKTNPFEKTITY